MDALSEYLPQYKFIPEVMMLNQQLQFATIKLSSGLFKDFERRSTLTVLEAGLGKIPIHGMLH